MRQYENFVKIVTNIRKVATSVYIDGEIVNPVSEGAHVMRWFFDVYMKKNPGQNARKACIEFCDNLKSQLLDWVISVEEDLYNGNSEH